MDVKLAKLSGFCFGVKRAIDTVYEQLNTVRKPIYTYGPIIHNKEVVKDLEGEGIKVVSESENISALEPGIMIIRSHGVSKVTKERLERSGFDIIDATCPFVKKIHEIVERESKQKKHIVIVGNASHPEVIGIQGWAKGNITVIETHQQAEEFTIQDNREVCIVSQTTFNYNKFQELVEIISKKRYDIFVCATICNATEERQTEAAAIAAASDAMIVIGDKQSSNTQKLFEICKEKCDNTYYIQTLSDLDLQKLESVRSVGITAGASTPNKIIQEVLEECQKC